MRICDLCGKDLGERGFRTTLGKINVDFCRECYGRFSSKHDKLLEEVDTKLLKWLKENKK